jgi:hypothetical protein
VRGDSYDYQADGDGMVDLAAHAALGEADPVGDGLDPGTCSLKTLIVLDHPYTIDSARKVPHQRSFSAAVAAAIRGARSAGHEIDLIDLVGAENAATTADLVSRPGELTKLLCEEPQGRAL